MDWLEELEKWADEARAEDIATKLGISAEAATELIGFVDEGLDNCDDPLEID